jgi:hypothetical protein
MIDLYRIGIMLGFLKAKKICVRIEKFVLETPAKFIAMKIKDIIVYIM